MLRLGRLKRRPEFLRVASKGRKAATPGVVLQALKRRGSPVAQAQEAGALENEAARPEGCGSVRVGFTASRKVGNAVERNRARRRLRAAVDQLFPAAAQPGWDYVLVARRGTLQRPWLDLLEDLRLALKRVEKDREEPVAARRPRSRRSRSGRAVPAIRLRDAN